LRVSADGTLWISSSRTMRGIDRETSRQRVRDALLSLEALSGPIALAGAEERPVQVESELEGARAAAERILSTPLTLVAGCSGDPCEPQRWTLDRTELARLLVLPEYGVDRPHLSVAGLRGWLPGVAAQWDVEPRPATYAIRGGRLLEASAPVEGRHLNGEAT